jgi:proline iminopeptidase
MKVAVLIVAVAFASCSTPAREQSRPALDNGQAATPREMPVPVGKATLFAREIGRGRPLIVLHGGPDFDHRYFLPDMDRFADEYRLIYYDQRGRGGSAQGVQPEDVSLQSDVSDLDSVRQYFQIESAAILGHSWGAVLALEYAVRHPGRVSHLILMNPAPVSADDFARFRKERLEKLGDDLARLRAAAATPVYQDGDPDAVTAYYRIHFKPALARSEDLEKVLASLRASFTKEGVLKARQIEDRLMNDTWLSKGYDLLPLLATLKTPTLVVYGDHDFIPAETAAARIARALPNARLVTFDACGHFAYLECPGPVRRAMRDFFQGAASASR